MCTIERFHCTRFSLLLCVNKTSGALFTDYKFFFVFFFEDVEKKVELKSPKLHTPRKVGTGYKNDQNLTQFSCCQPFQWVTLKQW